jgi:hypothetical protein
VPTPYSYQDLVILVPVLGRPNHIRPLLSSIERSTPGSRVLFLASPGDNVVIDTIKNAGQDYITVDKKPLGDYARKINVGYSVTNEPLIFTGASDLKFHPGWFEKACTYFDDPKIGVVGTNDLGNPLVTSGKHATHFLVKRSYGDDFGTIDGPGAILAEVYEHEFVDNELIATAKFRDMYVMALDSHVEHMHPHWNKGKMDDTYGAQPARVAQGRPVFESRAPRWTR